MALRFGTDGLVVIKKGLVGQLCLGNRARRLGFRKVADEVQLRLSWVLLQSSGTAG